MRPLFVAGCQRTGTTAFTEYLNDHPDVLVLRERYKYVARQVTFDHFAFERVLDYSATETNVPESQFVELLARKDPENLKWVGDKNPDYYKHFDRLLDQNPGAKFIVMYRPLEEVAESFEARARNPEDPWAPHYDFELSIKLWNMALNSTRKFVESGHGADVLLVGYDEFFYNNEVCIPQLSAFLEIEFDEAILASWRDRSAGFEKARRPKKEFSEEQTSMIREQKAHAAEEWVLDRIEQQKKDPDSIFGKAAGELSPRRPRPLSPKQRIEDLQTTLEEELRKAERLRIRNRSLASRVKNLERQLQGIRDSRSWRLLRTLGRVKARLTGKPKR